MKLFKTAQIAEIDRLTIANEPISDIDLMERASTCFANKLQELVPHGSNLLFFCGNGNNGGDGLAVARIVSFSRIYNISVYILNTGKPRSSSCETNLMRLKALKNVAICEIKTETDFPNIDSKSWVIDALFGSGLNRPLQGEAALLVSHINTSHAKVISIDIPSGLHGETNDSEYHNSCIKAFATFTFQFPKISFLLAENESFVGRWSVLDIKLHPQAIDSQESAFRYIEQKDIAKFIKQRSEFSHKGNFGHSLLIAGSYGMMGAAILSAKACLRGGTGLLTVHIPQKGYAIMQTSIPEAMVEIDESELMFTQSKLATSEKITAIGIGPGLGTKPNTQRGFHQLLLSRKTDIMVVDADALNCLSINPTWLELLPKGSILTPHPKEFDRIAGKSSNSAERIEKARQLSQQYGLFIVLKGAHTFIATPSGTGWFNSTGNAGMATAGSGDVLTGIILALLSCHYSSEEAAVLGVFIHGLAGDIAAAQLGKESLIASDIVNSIGKAFLEIHQKEA